MSKQSHPTVAAMGIDIGKNSFHVVGLDRRGATVLRQQRSRSRNRAKKEVSLAEVDDRSFMAKPPGASHVRTMIAACLLDRSLGGGD